MVKMTEQTPIHTQYREGNQDNPYVYKNENLIIDKNAKAFLTEFPERLYGVEVQSLDGKLFYETQEYSVRENEFNVDYESKTKAITFHQSQIGKQLNFVYKGTGLSYLSPSQIYTELNSEGIMETLDVYIKNMSKLKTQIENLLEKGSVATVAGKSGIVTNGDIHLINTILDGNAGNSATFLPLGVTLYPVKSKNINYPAEKGFVVTYKHSNIQTVQFFYPTEKEATHFRSWMSNTWSDWKTLTTVSQVNKKIEQSALRSSTPQTLVGRAIKDVKGLNLSVDLGGLTGSQRLVKDDYKLEFTAKRDSMIENISFPVNGRGKAILSLKEKVTTTTSGKEIITYKNLITQELYLQPIDVAHLVLLPIERRKTYQLTLKSDIGVLVEKDFDAVNIADNIYISDTKCLLDNTIYKGYAYFYDIKSLCNKSQIELMDARYDLENNKHPSLNKRLKADFDDVVGQIDHLDARENTLDLANREVGFYSDLGVLANTIPNCFAIDEQRDYIYLYQQTGGAPSIVRMTHTGVFLDSMDIPNGQPMHSLGLDYTKGLANFWVEVGNALVRFKYVPNGNLDLVTDKTIIKLANDSTRSKFGVAVDNHSNIVSYIVKNTIVAYSLSGAISGNNYRYDSITIDADAMSGLFGFQYYDDTAFILSSGLSTSNATYITTYNKEGRLLNYKIDIFGDIVEENPNTIRHTRSLQVVKNRTTNKISVVFSVTRGTVGYRNTKLYAIHQRFNDVKRLMDMSESSQNYQFTTSAGRSKLIPEGTTKLSDVTRPYYYYITAPLAKPITDIPMKDSEHGYFFEVKPANNWGVITQVIRNNGQQSAQMIFERNIDPLNNTIGRWNLTQGNMIDKINYWTTSIKKLSDYRYPTVHYIANDKFKNFSDIPDRFITGAGYWITVSTLGTNNAVIQTLTRNTLNDFFEAKRIVSDEGVGEFTIIHGGEDEK